MPATGGRDDLIAVPAGLVDAGASAVPKRKSKLYLVVHKSKDGGRFTDRLSISETLEKAKRAAPRWKESEETNKDPVSESTSAFLKLSQEVEKELETFRSLDAVLAFLLRANPIMQYVVTIEPALQKAGKVEHEDDHRKIYSIDGTNAGTVLKALNEGASGLKAAHHFPPLALIGLVSAYDVILQKLIRTALQSQDKIASTIDGNIKLKDLKTFSTIQEAIDFLVDREIDSILQKDHLDQLRDLNRLFNIEVDTENDGVKRFLEICERRNLYTHNAGIVACTRFG